MQKRPSVIIKIPHGSRVLLLEDSDLRIASFVKRIPDLVVATSVDEAIAKLVDGPFDLMFLDHDLGLLDYAGVETETSGLQFAKHLAATGFVASTVVIHSWSSVGSAAMKNCLQDAHVIPFGKFEING